MPAIALMVAKTFSGIFQKFADAVVLNAQSTVVGVGGRRADNVKPNCGMEKPNM